MKVAIISCVKTKLKTSKPVEAKRLYTSDLFKKSLEYTVKNYDKVLILSAHYYVLQLTDLVLPYEKTLYKFTKVELKNWANKAKLMLEQKINTSDELFFFCGIPYRSALIGNLKNKSHIPLKGVSFGNQLKFYKNELDRQIKLL